MTITRRHQRLVRLAAGALLAASSLTIDSAGQGATAGPQRVAELGREVARRFDPRADYPTTLPFVAMREGGGRVEVRIAGDDAWYAWESIDEVEAGDVLGVCEAAFGDRAWKRCTEDLVQVLALMGHEVGNSVTLGLRALDSGDRIVREEVPMTRANRDAVQRSADGDDGRTRPPQQLTADDVEADLRALENVLTQKFSYATMRDLDVAAEVGALRAAFREGAVARGDFALAVHRTICRFGDGHAGVRGLAEVLPREWLPFLVEQSAGGFVALRPDRSGFLDPEHPFVDALDGQPVDAWLEHAAKIVTAGSPQLVRRRAVRELREWRLVKQLAGDEQGVAIVEVRLRSADGGATKTAAVALSRRRPTYGTWPRPDGHRELDGRIGYLRIPSMTDDELFLDGIDTAMKSFRKTRGLIVDVRGNGGGTRDALRRLLPYLMTKREGPAIVNVAAARIAEDADPHERDGYLANRFLFPSSWPDWSSASRRAIAKASRAFRPDWDLPKRGFSGWHWFVIERRDNPAAYPYGKPVVVLMDHDCFSATDVFLGALSGRKGVTLLGTASGGGSARSKSYTLPRSRLRLRLGSMASFRVDGTRYDGVGVVPDVEVLPAAGDFVRGGGDAQLEEALRVLRGR